MLELDSIFDNVAVMLQTLSDILESEQRILIENNSISHLNEIKQYNIQPPYNEDPQLMLKWQAITNTTQRLAQLNRENGIIIQNRMNMTQQSIDYLKSINNPAVYTYNGYQQSETISSKRAKV